MKMQNLCIRRIKMTELKDIIDRLIKFRNERNWEQFHNSKDLALAISIEASELNELFLWKASEEVDVEKLKEELADVFIYAFLLANKHNISIREIVANKIKINEQKYPANKAINTAKKYSEL